MNFKNLKVKVGPIKFFEFCSVNLILQLCNTKVLDFDWISDGPLETDWNWWKLIGMFQHLELSPAVQCLSFKAQKKWFSVADLEKDV